MAPEVWAAGWVISLPAIAWAVRKVNKSVDERVVPFMAILAAGIFVAQMLNFPIGGGTTGHLIGAALATVLLGMFGAMSVITVILVIQCFIFGDGGLTALGLNLLNMAVIGSVVSWAILRAFPEKRRMLVVPIAAWASVFFAATACALELSVSYALSPGEFGISGVVSFPAMMGTHAIIGVGEAIITSGVLLYLAKVAPGMLKMRLVEKMEVETKQEMAA